MEYRNRADYRNCKILLDKFPWNSHEANVFSLSGLIKAGWIKVDNAFLDHSQGKIQRMECGNHANQYKQYKQKWTACYSYNTFLKRKSLKAPKHTHITEIIVLRPNTPILPWNTMARAQWSCSPLYVQMQIPKSFKSNKLLLHKYTFLSFSGSFILLFHLLFVLYHAFACASPIPCRCKWYPSRKIKRGCPSGCTVAHQNDVSAFRRRKLDS